MNIYLDGVIAAGYAIITCGMQLKYYFRKFSHKQQAQIGNTSLSEKFVMVGTSFSSQNPLILISMVILGSPLRERQVGLYRGEGGRLLLAYDGRWRRGWCLSRSPFLTEHVPVLTPTFALGKILTEDNGPDRNLVSDPNLGLWFGCAF